MKKKVKVMRPHDIWNSEVIKISKSDHEYYFEIDSEITIDLGEAIAIMMRETDWNDKVWNLSINDIDYQNIQPSKCLYWLSGGDEEWVSSENYKMYWYQCSLEFQEEFGITVVTILKKAKTLKDIRNGFLKHLNISTLYNFAIEREMA